MIPLTCPGQSDGHNWVLNDTKQEGYWIYRPHLTMFRARIAYTTSFQSGSSEYHIFSTTHYWYCSKCRQWNTPTAVVDTFETVLGRGYAIYDWKNKRTLYPEIEDALKLVRGGT